MRIAFDGRILGQKNITGVQRYAQNIQHELNKRLEAFKVFRPKDGKKWKAHFWEQSLLLPEVKAWQADVLFCPGNTAPIINKGKTKLVTVIHDLSYLYYPAAYSCSFKLYYRTIIPMIMRKSDAIITVSHSERLKILQYYPEVENKTHAVLNGIGDDFFDEGVSKDPIILYVGSLSKRKNFIGVLEAFLKICSEIPHKLVFLGGMGDIFKRDKSVSQLIARIPENRILFIGQVNDSAVLRYWYSKSELFIFPSYYESFGLPPLEAMACGCPVVVSGIPALRESCGDAAIYCNPFSIEDIAEKMMQVLSDHELQNKMIQKGYQQAKKFTWSRSAEETIDICQSII